MAISGWNIAIVAAADEVISLAEAKELLRSENAEIVIRPVYDDALARRRLACLMSGEVSR